MKKGVQLIKSRNKNIIPSVPIKLQVKLLQQKAMFRKIWEKAKKI